MLIKQKLIDKIKSIQDEKILEDIYSILEGKNSEHALTNAEKKAIEQGLQDISKGKVLSHDQVIQNAEKWLNSKK